jgi:hypothetical protein
MRIADIDHRRTTEISRVHRYRRNPVPRTFQPNQQDLETTSARSGSSQLSCYRYSSFRCHSVSLHIPFVYQKLITSLASAVVAVFAGSQRSVDLPRTAINQLTTPMARSSSHHISSLQPEPSLLVLSSPHSPITHPSSEVLSP